MNDNVLKNVAGEIARNCQAKDVNVEPEFVMYLVDLMLLNPKYGKSFEKTLTRNILEAFVNTVVDMIVEGGTPLNTVKMQFLIFTNYDKPQDLMEKYVTSIVESVRPLVDEIIKSERNDDLEALKKLHRKIAIYTLLCSGLGNPVHIVNLKASVAALQSVFTLDDLKTFVTQTRIEKLARLKELLELTAGVRLFNRDCRKTGDMIPDLPMDLIDACQACLGNMSNTLAAIMNRVDALTKIVEQWVTIDDETGNVFIQSNIDNGDEIMGDEKVTIELLIYQRQYELIVRRLLFDIEWANRISYLQAERYRIVLKEIHALLKYKDAAPVDTVFPLFKNLWTVWHTVQSLMFLVATVNRIMATLAAMNDPKRPSNRQSRTYDQSATRASRADKVSPQLSTKIDRARSPALGAGFNQSRSMIAMQASSSMLPRPGVGLAKNPAKGNKRDVSTQSLANILDFRERTIQYIGFCAVCLTAGALVPSNRALGVSSHQQKIYTFCNRNMMDTFIANPDRYVKEVLQYARDNIHVINLLNIHADLLKVRDVVTLVVRPEPKVKIADKDIQTEVHPIESRIDRNYYWNMWDVKRRACQLATMVNNRTHSTQTIFSHLRAEVPCQTTEPRDKCLQTMKEIGVNTKIRQVFLMGLRGHPKGEYQAVDLGDPCPVVCDLDSKKVVVSKIEDSASKKGLYDHETGSGLNEEFVMKRLHLHTLDLLTAVPKPSCEDVHEKSDLILFPIEKC